jgi:hypothetical protein
MSSIPAPVPDTPADPRYGPEAADLARGIRSRAEQAEPEITQMMVGIARLNGATMEQLDQRLKSTDSLTRKIHDTADSMFGGDLNRAAQAVDDAVRYTMVVGDGVYVGTLQHIINMFESNKYTLFNKNYWLPGDPYDGMNMKLTKDGVTAELQMLTPESREAKEQTHGYYETYRDPQNPVVARKQAWDAMMAIAAKTPRPEAYQTLLDIGSLELEKPNW